MGQQQKVRFFMLARRLAVLQDEKRKYEPMTKGHREALTGLREALRIVHIIGLADSLNAAEIALTTAYQQCESSRPTSRREDDRAVREWLDHVAETFCGLMGWPVGTTQVRVEEEVPA